MSGAKPPVGPACRGYLVDADLPQLRRVHCPGCAESASLRQRLATAEAALSLARSNEDCNLILSVERGDALDAALADAAALREQLAITAKRVNYALGMLRKQQGEPRIIAEEVLAQLATQMLAATADQLPTPIPAEPDGASGAKGQP